MAPESPRVFPWIPWRPWALVYIALVGVSYDGSLERSEPQPWFYLLKKERKCR